MTSCDAGVFCVLLSRPSFLSLSNSNSALFKWSIRVDLSLTVFIRTHSFHSLSFLSFLTSRVARLVPKVESQMAPPVDATTRKRVLKVIFISLLLDLVSDFTVRWTLHVV